MTSAPTSITIAPILFVFAPDGRIETLGGFRFDPDDITRDQALRIEPADAGLGKAALLDRLLAGEVGRRLRGVPGVRVTSRLRPLLPRLGGTAEVVLPMWALARIELDGLSAANWTAAVERHPFGMGAAARLAAELDDAEFEREAEGEFRRALAGDPMSNRLTGEEARLRTLAVDELARSGAAAELPPLLAMLPNQFSIEELRLAIARITRTPDERVESSSNFRRRVHELLDHGVLREAGEADAEWSRRSPVLAEDQGSGSRLGRRPTLFEFDGVQWRHWLVHRAGGAEEIARRESPSVLRRALEEVGDLDAPWDSAPPRSIAMRYSVEPAAAFHEVHASLPIDPPSGAEVDESGERPKSRAKRAPRVDPLAKALRDAEEQLAASERRLAAERTEVRKALREVRKARGAAEKRVRDGEKDDGGDD